MESTNDQAAEEIRRRVCEALAFNRRPGMHYPGYLLGLTWPHIGEHSIVEEMMPGPHCADARGEVHFTALGVMIDSALATSARLAIAPGARMATVHLNAQFTGARASGRLRMPTQFQGFSVGDAVPQALSKGVLYADDKALCHAAATFVVLPPPAHVKLAPLPWQEEPRPAPPPLALEAMSDDERSILDACDGALSRVNEDRSFSDCFWDIFPQRSKEGAYCEMTIGVQHGNRVHHVQGGLLFGLAAKTACAAVPDHPMLSNIATWYISPGQGKALSARSHIIHRGRSFAVVRTEIRNTDDALVLEAVSNHAAAR